MKKIFILPISLISLLFLVACGGEQQQVVTGAFLGGTQGVLAVFEPFGVEDGGVYSIFDSETYPLEVTLNNKGEYELQKGDVTIKLQGLDFDSSGISSLTLKNKDLLEEASELLPNGGEETITFATDAKYTPAVSGKTEREWFANIEYKYQTYVVMPDVCLKEDLTDDRVCEVEGTKTFFVSGAPITVSGVEESTAGKGIMALKITIRNAGTGKVTLVGEDFGTQQKVGYNIDDSTWECKQGGKLNEARLIDGTAEIVCKLKTPLTAGTLATKQLKLTLEYKYRDIIQETLRIKEGAK